ncbi:MAG: hypothetical protein CMJ83_20100 [Planctomycetes bacterium]|jgi:hypothetical protein|nr:hypothetical protein [Planctomycetota bacterium]
MQTLNPTAPTITDPDQRRQANYALSHARRRLSGVRMLFVGAAAWSSIYIALVLWMQFGSAGILVMPTPLFRLS